MMNGKNELGFEVGLVKTWEHIVCQVRLEFSNNVVAGRKGREEEKEFHQSWSWALFNIN